MMGGFGHLSERNLGWSANTLVPLGLAGPGILWDTAGGKEAGGKAARPGLIPNPAEEFSERHAACGHQW